MSCRWDELGANLGDSIGNAKKQVGAGVLGTDRRNDLVLLKISSLKMASVETQSLIQKLGIKIFPQPRAW